MTNFVEIMPKAKTETNKAFVRRAVSWYYGPAMITFNKSSIRVLLDTITPLNETKKFVDGVGENLEEANIEYVGVNAITGEGPNNSTVIVGFRITL